MTVDKILFKVQLLEQLLWLWREYPIAAACAIFQDTIFVTIPVTIFKDPVVIAIATII